MQTSHDHARRRKTVRRGRERGCWLYVPAEQLVETGFQLSEPPPYYKTWPGRKRTILVQFYTEP